MKHILLLVVVFALASCSTTSRKDLDGIYGPSKAHNRAFASLQDVILPTGVAKAEKPVDYWKEVKPILDTRCVACHGCYDAPCQLKITAIEGINRGAIKSRIHNPTRLNAAELTRLFEDGHDTASWRKKGFYSVLNEHVNSVEANQEAGVLHQLLELKERKPLPDVKILSKEDFTVGLNRDQVCAPAEEIETFTTKHPL